MLPLILTALNRTSIKIPIQDCEYKGTNPKVSDKTLNPKDPGLLPDGLPSFFIGQKGGTNIKGSNFKLGCQVLT